MRTSEEATDRIHQFIQSLPDGALFTGEELPRQDWATPKQNHCC